MSDSLDPDQSLRFYWAWSGSKLFAKVISRRQNLSLAGICWMILLLPSIITIPGCCFLLINCLKLSEARWTGSTLFLTQANPGWASLRLKEQLIFKVLKNFNQYSLAVNIWTEYHCYLGFPFKFSLTLKISARSPKPYQIFIIPQSLYPCKFGSDLPTTLWDILHTKWENTGLMHFCGFEKQCLAQV